MTDNAQMRLEKAEKSLRDIAVNLLCAQWEYTRGGSKRKWANRRRRGLHKRRQEQNVANMMHELPLALIEVFAACIHRSVYER